MPFHVMHRDNRAAPGQSQAVGHAAADHQRTDQAWPGGIGDRVGLIDTRLFHNLLN